MFTIIIIILSGFIFVDMDGPKTLTEKEGLHLSNINEEMLGKDIIYEGYTTFLPDPTPFTLNQPNGFEFEARMIGESVGGHVETLEGYSIVQDEMGWWTYARKNENGVLVATYNLVGEINPITISDLEKHLFNDPPEIRQPEYDILPRSTRAPPHNTTWKAIAIMLNFTDEDFDSGHDKAHYEQLLNGTTGNTFRTYYREVSYGQFDVEVDVVGPFASSHHLAYYGGDDHGLDTGDGPIPRNICEMAREAVQLADPTVDFSQYDIDDDNIIDALFIIHAGPGQEQSGVSTDIWSHKSNIFPGESVDGVTAFPYSTEPENGKVGVFAHEFGHVLGLPDLYDTDDDGSGGDSSGIGQWGIMASGSWNGFPSGSSPAHFCAWSKIVLGWVDPIIVTSDVSLTRIEIPPVENNSVVYKIWAHDPAQDTDEYFLVENRQKLGYDSALPGDGILIWHIDESVTTVNDNPNHLLVDLEEYDNYDGTQELQTKNGLSEATDPWENTVTGFRDSTDPNSYSYNGSTTGVWVWNISNISGDNNMSIGFKEIYSGPTEIFISDPVSNTTIKPVYDFVLNDTYFPDEDVGYDNEGNNGSFILESRRNGTSDPWEIVSPQVPREWIGGVKGVINCTMLEEGYWDFRVKIIDEEGHLFYTPIVWNIAVPTDIPPVANAGPDNFTDVKEPAMLDGSASSDNSGYIAWFNWTFGDGSYYNGTTSKVVHNWSEPGNYTVILNVSDSFGNWDTDTMNMTVRDISPPVTTLLIGSPKYRENEEDNWNVTNTSNPATSFTLSAIDNWAGVNFTWYMIDSEYFIYTGFPFDLSGYDEGPHNIGYGSEDNLGNNETGNNITVVLDNTPPTLDINIGSPKYRKNVADIWNVTITSLFSLLTYDQYSGVNYTSYFNVTKVSGPYYESSFTMLGNDEGFVYIIFKTEDNLGNYITNDKMFNIDTSHPVINISVGMPRYRAQVTDNWNITTSTPLTITDNGDGFGSGINFTWYTIDGIYYEYSIPFTLTPGMHTITWGGMDNLGMNETGNSQIINVDIQPPTSSLNINPPKFRENDFDIWNVTNSTEFNLQSQDQSGVYFSWYIIDGMYFEGATFTLAGYGEGLYDIIYGSEDNLENNETGIFTQIYLELTPPTTSFSIGEPKYRNLTGDYWNITSNTEFSMISTDNRTGVNVTWYTVDGIYYEANNFILSGFIDGLHTITWGAYDNIGNNETGNTITVLLDATPPITSLTVGDPKYRENPIDIWNITETTPITLSATDLYSGMNKTWYIINGEYFEGTVFTLAGFDEGLHTIVWGSIDNLGNNGTGNTMNVNLDKSSPTTNLLIGEPKFRGQATDLWNVSDYTGFSIVDANGGDLCGIDFMWYFIDGDYYEYSTPFTLNAGLHTIAWGGMDNLGMNETGNTISIVVDVDAPITNITIGEPKYRDKIIDDWNVTDITLFTLFGSDQDSGVNYSWYMIDGYYFEGSEFNLSGFASGLHTILWGSVDNVDNNETANQIQVLLDASPPQTLLTINNPKYQKYAWDNWNVTTTTQFSLTSSDPQSGVNFTWYTIDGNYFEGEYFNLSGFSQGQHLIIWGSVNGIGYNETGNWIYVILDISSPVTDMNIGDPKYRKSGSDNWNVTDSTSFTLLPSDQYSGIDITWYTIDGNYYEGVSFTLSGYLEGLRIITWGSIDNLGHTEIVNSITVNLDTTPPIVDITIGPPKFRAQATDNWNVTDFTEFTITHNNDGSGSGINLVWYIIDGVFYEYLTPFTLSAGTHTIFWGAEDNLGLNESGSSLSVTVDVESPQTDITLGSPKFRGNISDNWNITDATTITLQSQDQFSGVKVIWYEIDGQYFEGAGFNLIGYADGPHTICWGALDNIGYNETGNVMILILDNSPPSTELIVGEPKNRNNDDDYWNVTVLTPFTLYPNDPYSGVNISWYSIDGIYFEGLSFNLSGYSEGLHTITWGSLDNFSWNETNSPMMVILINTMPLTTLTIDGPKYRGTPLDFWNVSSISVFKLTPVFTPGATDFTWYWIDSEYFEGDTFTLSGRVEGLHILKWGSQDVLGYNETGNLRKIILDDTGPETTIEIGDPKYREDDTEDWIVTPSTIITLSVYDQYSSVNYTWYTINGDYYEGKDFNLSKYEDGLYVITWASLDYLGNIEATRSINLYLDSTPPITTLNLGTPKHRDSAIKNWNVTSDTEFSLSSSDSISGMDLTWYMINNDYYEGSTFYLLNYNEGLVMIRWGGRDNIGNNETGKLIIVILDNSPPITELEIGEPKYYDTERDTWAVIETTQFTLLFTDNFSGVKFTWYKIDNYYFEGINFNLDGFDEGIHIITWGSVDNLDNIEVENTCQINLDMLPPTTQLELGTPNHRANEYDKWNVTDSTTFTLVAEDHVSGVNLTWYTIDGDYFEGLVFSLKGQADGPHTIVCASKDNLGREEAQNVILIYLDNQPPSVSIEIGWPNQTVGNVVHITPSTPISLMASDSGVGISTLFYSIDGGATFSVYSSPFTVPSTTTKIIYGARDILNNEADELSIDVVVESKDTDKDGIYDLGDADDDNDGLTDKDEEQIGTDPLNPDTDGDGHDDMVDKYPLDESKYREPTDWEKLPILGGFEQSLCISLLIIGVIVIIILFFVLKRYRIWKAKSSWKEKPDEKTKNETYKTNDNKTDNNNKNK